MRVGWRSLVCFAVVAFASALHAQTLDSHDKTFVNAAQIVLGYDLLVARCREAHTFAPDDSATLATWTSLNEVERIRERTRALEQDPEQRGPFAMVRRVFSMPFTAKGQSACRSAVSSVKRDNAQFAKNSPLMIAALRAQGGAVATAAPPTRDSAVESGRNPSTAVPPPPPASRAPAPTGSTTAASALAPRIDRFGFDTRAAMGVGGFITTKIFPVVLFRDGTALTDVEGLSFAGGLDAHRRANPDDWTRWRKEGAEYQLQKKSGTWEKLPFRKTYSTLPAGFRLNGLFRSLSGVGNVAIGGTSSVTAVSEYTFGTDGRAVRGGAVGSTSSAGDVSVVTSNVPPSRRGRYEIDGITLRIKYDDGQEEARIIVTDPDDPKSVIWLDGTGYVRR